MAKKTTDAPPDPDKLIRKAAGSYRTADDRFEVREADGGWFLVDGSQSNEFGQELMHGPFPTLKALRDAIPGARETKAAPMRPKRREKESAKAKAKRPPPPPSWIDQLPRAEAARVRLLIRALEGEGVAHAEQLVRRDRDGLVPAVATALIQRRLDALVEEAPEKERKRARQLLRRAADVFTVEGLRLPDPLSGWTVVEREEPKRRIDL